MRCVYWSQPIALRLVNLAPNALHLIKSTRPHWLQDHINYGKYLAMDGLAQLKDPERERLDEITSRYDRQIEQLKKQVEELKKSKACLACKDRQGMQVRADDGQSTLV